MQSLVGGMAGAKLMASNMVKGILQRGAGTPETAGESEGTMRAYFLKRNKDFSPVHYCKVAIY